MRAGWPVAHRRCQAARRERLALADRRAGPGLDRAAGLPVPARAQSTAPPCALSPPVTMVRSRTSPWHASLSTAPLCARTMPLFHVSSRGRQVRPRPSQRALSCLATWAALGLTGCSSEPLQTPGGPGRAAPRRRGRRARCGRAQRRTALCCVARRVPRHRARRRHQRSHAQGGARRGRVPPPHHRARPGPTRGGNGQAKLAQWRPKADAAASRYGVPAPVLVAVWGMESNYGQNYGDVPVIDALATLAFEGRREAWARGELLAALKIIQQGDVDHDHMIGSWAGAMGQTQFMPSAFLARAVDADGDGRRDIWRSMPDVFASTANYLHQAGWVAGEAWAPEVKLPEGFDVSRADPGVRQDASQWNDEGVRLAAGPPLPAMAQASILQPAGARGPAFLVGRNFRAVLRYNNATSYALGVSLLAQRIDGGAPVQAAGPVGPATRGALRDWQRSVGLPADGFPTAELLARLQGQ